MHVIVVFVCMDVFFFRVCSICSYTHVCVCAVICFFFFRLRCCFAFLCNNIFLFGCRCCVFVLFICLYFLFVCVNVYGVHVSTRVFVCRSVCFHLHILVFHICMNVFFLYVHHTNYTSGTYDWQLTITRDFLFCSTVKLQLIRTDAWSVSQLMRYIALIMLLYKWFHCMQKTCHAISQHEYQHLAWRFVLLVCVSAFVYHACMCVFRIHVACFSSGCHLKK